MENETANVSQPGKIAFLGYMEFDSGASYRGAILIKLVDKNTLARLLVQSRVSVKK